MIRYAPAIFAMIIATGCAKDPIFEAQVEFDFSDDAFADFSADATLEAIGSISQAADAPVRVGFKLDDEVAKFVFSTGERYFRGAMIVIDTPHLHVSYDRITHDDEEVSIEEATLRIRRYAEAARLTDSRPAFRLTAAAGAKNSMLAELLEIIAAEGVVHLLTEPSVKPVVANPPPRRVGTPHKIRSSDLFPTGAP